MLFLIQEFMDILGIRVLLLILLTHLFRNGKQKSYPNFESVFHGLVHHEIQAGVVPFENSYTGEVGEVLDLLFQYDVYIQKKYDT